MNVQLDENLVKQNLFAPNSKSTQSNAAPVLNKNTPAVLTLLQNGMILACNKACGELLGVEPEKLVWQPISRLLPQFADISLILDKKINPYLKFLSVAGHQFDVVSTNGRHVACELFFSIVDEFGKCCLQITMKPFRQRQAATLRHLRTY
jgi:nitrogen-specific signal transduction histidine kinase